MHNFDDEVMHIEGEINCSFKTTILSTRTIPFHMQTRSSAKLSPIEAREEPLQSQSHTEIPAQLPSNREKQSNRMTSASSAAKLRKGEISELVGHQPSHRILHPTCQAG